MSATETPGYTRLPVTTALSIFLPFAGGYFLSYIFRTVNAIIAPELVADARLSAASLGWLTSVYFLAFALFQLPIGLLLDRFGPRRVEAVLLLFAALGAILFALADNLAMLTVGRAFVGVGVACCMMASFKAFVMWFPPHRLPFLNGCLLTFGALGAITATLPVQWWLANLSDWRGLFLALGGLSGTIALLIFYIVPDHHEAPLHLTLRAQLGGLTVIFRDIYFWRVGIGAAMSQGASLAVAGLWAGPWLRDVAGLDRNGVALYLMVIAIAMGVGFFSMGMLAAKLTRIGIRLISLAGAGMAAFTSVMVVLALGFEARLWLTLSAFGFLATSGSLSYAIVSQHFPRQLAARANTAQNLLVFVFAFIMQWAIGIILGHWEDPVTRNYEPLGYRVAFGAIAAMQALALVWFFTLYRRHPETHDR